MTATPPFKTKRAGKAKGLAAARIHVVFIAHAPVKPQIKRMDPPSNHLIPSDSFPGQTSWNRPADL
jgi:hypothetical protein